MASGVNFGSQQYFGVDPRTIPGCTLWLDATDPNGTGTLPTNGQNLTSWVDKSANGYTVSQNAALTVPVFRTGLATNGLPGIDFTGGAGLLSATSFAKSLNVTVFLVGMVRSTIGNWGTFWGHFPNGDHDNNAIQLRNTAGQTVINWHTNNNNTTSQLAYTLNSMVLYSCTMTNGNIMFMQQTNTAGTTSVTVTNGAVTINTAVAPIWVGRSDSAEAINSYIYEIVYYQRVLTTSERLQAEGYLATKWGLQANLLTSHPYRSIRPAMRLFQPVDVPGGALLWLDAADAATITGSPVTQWRDKSGRASNAVTGLGSVVAGTAINSRNTLRFGLNTTLNLSNFIMPSAQTSVFYIIRGITSNANTGAGTGYFIFSRTVDNFLNYTGTNQQFFAYQNPPAARSYIGVMGAGGERSWGNLPAAGAFANATSVISFTGMAYGSSNGLSLPLFGTSNVVNSVFTATTYQISTSRNIGDVYTYDLGELIVCDGTVSIPIAQQIEGYLAWKWGVRNSLPVTHPYRNVLPSTALFTPAQVSGLTFWLDGADPTSMTLSGSTITQWRDKSVNGFVGTPAGSPLQTTLNGLPAVAFNGSTQYFSFGDVADLGSANLNIFCVMKFNSTANGSIVAKSLLGSAAFRYSLLKETGNLSTLLESTVGVQSVGTVADSSLETRVLSWTWDRTSNILYRDGTLASSVAFANAGTFNSTYTLLIGAYNNGSGGTPPTAGFYLNGVICELVFIFGPMTTLERQQMEGYLAWKWSLQSRLPATHPFLRFRP